jgi:hypothetical protein
MPSLDDFIEALDQEKENLVSMGSIKGSRYHALAENEARKLNFKDRKKGKAKTPRLEKKSSRNRQMNLI